MEDVLIAPIWLGATVFLVYAAWALGRRVFPDDRFAPCLMHSSILIWASIVGIATLLGTIGWLGPVLLMVGVGVAAGVMLWSCRTRHRVCKESLPQSAQESGQADITSAQRRFQYLSTGLWGLALALAFSFIVLRGLLRFPSDYDTLNYHLPLIVQWLHQGSLYAPAEAIWFAPGNNELVGLWFVAPFSGDFLFCFLNLLSVLLLTVASLELGRQLGWSRPWSSLAALAVLITGPVFREITDANNDLAVTALFLAVIAYAIRYARTASLAPLVFGSITLGLLAGVKYYALGYALVAGTGWILLIMLTRGFKVALRCCVALVLGSVLWGGYWYARNLAIGGSPIYPQGLTSATDTLGEIRTRAGQSSVWQTTLFGNGRPEVFAMLRAAIWRWTGPCHGVAFFVLPVVLVWLCASSTRYFSRSGTHGAIRLALVFWTLSAGIVWGITPFAVEVVAGTFDSLETGYHPVRYGLGFLNLCLFSFVTLCYDVTQLLNRSTLGAPSYLHEPEPSNSCNSIRRWIRPAGFKVLSRALLVIAAGGVIYQLVFRLRIELLAEPWDLLVLSLNQVFAGAIFFLVWDTLPHWRRSLTAALASTLTVGAVLAIGWLGQKWHAGFAKHYDAQYDEFFPELQRSDPATTRICAMTYSYYPYFGSHRQFYVCRPYWVPSFAILLEYLREHQITVIVALEEDSVGVPRYAGKSDWLRQNPELFGKIKDGPRHYVCRVNSDLLKAPTSSR